MIKKLYITIILTLFILINTNIQAHADSTALSASGDNVGPYNKTPQVVLDKEIINLDVSVDNTIVNVTFYLRNEGPTETILVGFPDEQASDQINLKRGLEMEPANVVGPIQNFKAFINGKPVKTTLKPQVNKKIVADYPKNYKMYWHVWPVTFKKGQTTVIKNSYQVKNGNDVYFRKNFCYTLITGAKWKGKIGDAKIYASLKGKLNASDIITEPSNEFETMITTKGMVIVDPKNVMWEFKNFEPNSSENGLGYFKLFFNNDLIPMIKTRNLTENDLKTFDKFKLRTLRNEIYARHGRPFKDENLTSYFQDFAWYKVNPNYSDTLLNEFEKRNAAFILQYEKKIHSDIIYGE